MIPMQKNRSVSQILFSFFWTFVGAFLAAASIKIFLLPNHLIDGGIIGLSMILTQLTTSSLFPLYYVVLTIPFIYLSYKFIRRTFFIHMIIAVLLFALSLIILEQITFTFESDFIIQFIVPKVLNFM